MRKNMGLCRGKREDNGEWVYGYLLPELRINGKVLPSIIPADKNGSAMFDEDGDYIVIDVIPETIGQYTGGQIDKNGKMIFEGDIVDIIPEDEPSVIKWDDDSARFVIINSCERDFDNYWGHELEIIGNIHDNPELLEGD